MTAHNTGRHRLEVENFGPIAKADVELRQLTVLFGPSNAGKSYLAKLVYALHEGFGHRHVIHVGHGDLPRRALATPNLAELIDRLEAYLGDRATEGETVSLEEDWGSLARAAAKTLWLAPPLRHELLRVYGTNTLLDLVRRHQSTAMFTLSYTPAGNHDEEPSFRHALAIKTDESGELSYELDISRGAPIHFHRSGSRLDRGRDDDLSSAWQLVPPPPPLPSRSCIGCSQT